MDPTASDWTRLGIHMVGVALVVFPAVRFVVKPALRWHISRDGKRTRAELSAYRNAVRLSAVVVGALFGILPEVWPEWVPAVWAAGCGGIAGSFSIVIHEAVQKGLGERLAGIIAGKSVAAGADVEE